MTIKGMDGQHYDVASSGTGGTALGLGIAGTALGLLNNNNNGNCGILGGLFGGNNCNGDNQPVTRYEANMMLQLNAKDGEIALLKADKYTDQKIVETTAYLMGKIADLQSKVDANRDAQNAINTQQAVYNGTNTATISCIQGQVAQLQSLSQLVVPQRNVCNTCCGCQCAQ